MPKSILPAALRSQTIPITLILMLFAGFARPGDLQAAALTAGTASGTAGSAVALTVSLSPNGGNVSSFQFDLIFPPLACDSAVLGSASAAADKSITHNPIAGGVRVIVFSLANRTSIGPGPVAVVNLIIPPGTPPGTVPVTLQNVTLSNPDGLAVPGEITNGGVTVTALPDNTAPVISGVGATDISSLGAVIVWTTNEAGDSQVEYGTASSYGQSSIPDTGKVASHSVGLTGLSPGTTYHCRVKSRDAAGNLAASEDFIFTTQVPQDTTPPVISGVGVSNISASRATVTWRTNEAADTQVEYGATASCGQASAPDGSMITAHTVNLTGLSAGTVHHFRVRSRDAAGNLAVSGDFTFETSSAPDMTPPVISAVAVSNVTATGAVIGWLTDEPAGSQVEYGTDSAYGMATELKPALSLTHSQALSGLQPGTAYHFRVKSRDAAGHTAVSGDYTFATEASSDGTPPVITDVRASGVTHSGVTILWSTNEAADSLVEYGTSASYGKSSVLNPVMTMSHARGISALSAGTTYHYRVRSADAAGNVALSGDFTFTTLTRPKDTALTLYYPRPLTARSGQPGNDGNEEFIGLALANLGRDTSTLMFTAYDAAGGEVSGPDIVNPVSRDLEPGRQLPIIDTELFGGGMSGGNASGWIKIESSTADVSGFFLMFDAGLEILDGATVTEAPLTSFVLPEIEGGGFTRLDIANPNDAPVTLALELRRGDGSVRVAETRTLGPHGALVADLFTEVFASAVPEASDYVRVTADKGVLPFELLGKSGVYIEGLNGLDAGEGGVALYSPQYAAGGGWHTELSIVNLDPNPGFLTLRFLREDATQIGATKVMQIAANGKIHFSDPAFFESLSVDPYNILTQGYLEIVSDGVRLAGSVVFGDPERGRFSSALPLVSRLETSLIFSHVASDSMYFTGVAILNPNDVAANATIEIYGADGVMIASVAEGIPAGQRISRVLTEYFPALQGCDQRSGYILVRSDVGVAGFALFGTNSLSVLSAVPAQAAP